MKAINANATKVIAERFSVSRFWQEFAATGPTSTNLLASMVELVLHTETPEGAAARENSQLRNSLGTCALATQREVEVAAHPVPSDEAGNDVW